MCNEPMPVCAPDCTPEEWPARREEILALFEQNVFGVTPKTGFSANDALQERASVLSGRATYERHRLTIQAEQKSASLEVVLLLPACEKPVPAVLMISNHDRAPVPPPSFDAAAMERLMAEAPAEWRAETQRMMAGMGKGGAPELLDIERDFEKDYWPAARIVEAGRAAAVFYASEAQPDDRARFPEGVASLFVNPEEPRKPDGIGTLGIWAFAASRVVDLLCRDARIDAAKISVAGHSRGGKTALWCAAQDARIHGVLVNNSGCSGAALSRGKRGENVASINAFFPHWFCPRYAQYAWREEDMPFDQHLLLAAVAPRPCYVTSGTQDAWSDPDAEWRGVCAASEAWRIAGGDVLSGSPPPAGAPLCAKGIGYHRREGGHDLTLWDWEQFLRFLEKNEC